MTTRPRLKPVIDHRTQATRRVAEFPAKDYDLVGSEHKHTKLAGLPRLQSKKHTGKTQKMILQLPSCTGEMARG